MAAIETVELSKRYSGAKTYALTNLSLKVESGEVYGFLGANGAGKSTTIRTLLNFIQPTRGSATIMGNNIVKDSVAVKRDVGYLAGEVALYRKMTGRHFLKYMAALQPPKHREYVRHLAEAFHADLGRPLSDLSKGNRQKIGVIQAFMHEPAVLILDEPTSGLDPLMQEVFYNEVKTAKARGAAVFVSSHNMAEVQRMCDRVGFIREGKLVAEQSIADLTATAAQTFDITFADTAPLVDLQHVKHLTIKSLAPNRITVHVQGDLRPLLQVLARSRVKRLDKPEVNLEEEFLHFYEQKETER